jgi:hypothetical protein
MEGELGKSQTEASSGPEGASGKDRPRPTEAELSEILRRHALWLEDASSEDAERANLWGADLRRADLQKANLQKANLQKAILWGAILQIAILQGADLQGADLRGADFRGADLRSADLQGADLQRTDLRNANLSGANLRNANLWSADLQSADLKGVYLLEANLSTVRGLESAIVRLMDLEGAILPERFARLFRGSNEREGTMAASEACVYKEANSGNTPEPMRTSIEVNDILQMQVRRLASSDQDAFEKLIQRLQRDGLVGLPEADKERLEEETLPEKGPVWRVRVNDEYRAFVLEKDADLEIAHLASVETLKKMRSLSASN